MFISEVSIPTERDIAESAIAYDEIIAVVAKMDNPKNIVSILTVVLAFYLQKDFPQSDQLQIGFTNLRFALLEMQKNLGEKAC